MVRFAIAFDHQLVEALFGSLAASAEVISPIVAEEIIEIEIVSQN